MAVINELIQYMNIRLNSAQIFIFNERKHFYYIISLYDTKQIISLFSDTKKD